MSDLNPKTEMDNTEYEFMDLEKGTMALSNLQIYMI